MKKILLLSAALVAALAGQALAQRPGGAVGNGSRAAEDAPRIMGQQDGGRRGGDRGDRGDRGGFQREQQAAPPAPTPQVQAQRENGARPGFNRDNDNRNDGRRDFRRDNDRRPDFNRGNDNRFDGRRDFGRTDRFDGRRDFGNRRYSQHYRSWSSPNRFRAGVYYRPQGFTYRRWSYGDILPGLFWSSRYWLNNYYAYDLPPPPVGTVWVRYGDDALLIDRYSGEVIQVSYSVFW